MTSFNFGWTNMNLEEMREKRGWRRKKMPLTPCYRSLTYTCHPDRHNSTHHFKCYYEQLCLSTRGGRNHYLSTLVFLHMLECMNDRPPMLSYSSTLVNYICFRFNFDPLKLNYFTSTLFYFILLNWPSTEC